MTYTALDDAANMSDVPRRVEALVRAVLAHWAHPNAVRESHSANLEGTEKLGDGLAISTGSCSARRRILLGGVEGHSLGGDIADGLLALLGLIGAWCRRAGDRDAMMRVADALL